MNFGVRVAALGAAALVAACALTSCGGVSSPTAEQKKAVRNVPSTTTTTAATPTSSTAVTSPTTTHPQVTVPSVIGLKIAAAHADLRAAGFSWVALNTPCKKGTLASQSVVSSLAIPGRAPDVHLGAVALNPGAVVPVGTRDGINWSGCFGDASTVPAVTGFTFSAARHALHAVGLSWACYSAGTATTTSTKPPTTTTTVKTPHTVLTQIPAAGTVLHPGATVSLIMHHCPQ